MILRFNKGERFDKEFDDKNELLTQINVNYSSINF